MSNVCFYLIASLNKNSLNDCTSTSTELLVQLKELLTKKSLSKQKYFYDLILLISRIVIDQLENPSSTILELQSLKHCSNVFHLDSNIEALEDLIVSLQKTDLSLIYISSNQLSNIHNDFFLISFLLRLVGDHSGRKLEEMWSYSFQDKETVHDYIQFLFPTKEMSNFNYNAPTETFILILKDPNNIRMYQKIQQNMRISFQSMVTFWGQKLISTTENGKLIMVTDNTKQEKNWIINGHNHLRMSRVLDSLQIFELNDELEALWKYLNSSYQKFPKQISKRSFNFWLNIYNNYAAGKLTASASNMLNTGTK